MKKYLFILVLLFVPVSVNALDIVNGKFRYTPAFEEPTKEKFYYRDEYFTKSSKIDDQHLLTMSYNLALSTFEVENTKYVTELYDTIGFKNIKTEGINDNTIGTAIAYKKIENYTLVAVAIRGGQYQTEWTNNFYVGEKGNAKGFNDSSITVINRIKQYIKDNKLKNIKLWIVGYSRAGAIANLTGVYINNHLKEFKTKENDLYVYTFEAPAVSTNDKIYDNIYTVRNKNDMVPFAYPKNWGFYNNGKLIEIGEDEKITVTYGLLQKTEANEIEINKFLNNYFNWLTQNLSRETYYNELEEPITELAKIFFSKSPLEREKIYKLFAEDLKASIVLDLNFQNEFLNDETLDLMYNYNYLYYDLTRAINEKLDKLKDKENASVLTDEEFETIKYCLYPIIKTLGPVIYKDYIEEHSMHNTMTLFKNINEIIINHYPQHNLKILQDMDSYYNLRDNNVIIYAILLVICITTLIIYNKK